MRTSRWWHGALAGAVALGCVSLPGTAAAEAGGRLSALAAVSCPTVSTCLAVGSGRHGEGAVVATTDAGETWTRLTPPPEVEQLTAVSCWTARRCLVGGSGFGDAGAIYRTLDGGATWQVTDAANVGGFFLSVDCSPSALLCAAGGNGGAIRTSTDKGRTWSAQTLSTISMINGIECVSASVCEGVGYFGGADFGGYAVRTTDAGLTWPATKLPKVMAFPTGVSCPTTDRCVAVAQDTVNAGSTQIGRTALTLDGGATWQRHLAPKGYFTLNAVSCPSIARCEAAGGGRSGMIGSTNGGRGWTPQGPETFYERGMSCPTESICYAVGESRLGAASVHRTADGGQTWIRQPIG